MQTEAQAITKVLDRLRAYLGTGETPPGSNRNFIVTWYNETVERIGVGPWCEMTNTWAMWTGGAKLLKSGRAYTVWAAQDGQKGINGSKWFWGTAGMRPGDQVYYDWAGTKGNEKAVDHTGTVEQVFGDGTFYVLEGNFTDMLRRMRRDGKYVVGYVRFDWSRILDDPAPSVPVVKPNPPKPVPDRAEIARIQNLLKVTNDGYWGPNTDERALRMRNAARAKAGWPTNTNVGFNIKDVQYVIGTPQDGIWGPKSQAALITWIAKFQRELGVTADGEWGPNTDNAFLALRNQSLNNY
jgi:hypothetical protein